MKQFLIAAALVIGFSGVAQAQNSNCSTEAGNVASCTNTNSVVSTNSMANSFASNAVTNSFVSPIAAPVITPDYLNQPFIHGPKLAPIANPVTALPAPVVTLVADPRFDVDSYKRSPVSSTAFVVNDASDVAAAHRDGWSGQNTNILNSSIIGNLIKQFAPSANFGSKQELGVAANSTLDVRFNFYAQGTVDATKLGGLLMTNQQNDNLNKAIRGAISPDVTQLTRATVSLEVAGIIVQNDTVIAGNAQVVVDLLRVPSVNANRVTYKVTPGNVDHQASFSSIANAPTLTEQYKRSAYLLGSASIIQSKFTGMNSVDIVKVMDQNRGVGGAFNLAGSLAARSLR